MKYNIGDKVRIKDIDWYNENKDPKHGFVYLGNGICFYSHMSKYCGKTMTISDIFGCCYVMAEYGYDNWTDEMIECKVEEETKVGTALNPIEPKSNTNCLTMERVDETKPEPKFKVGDKVRIKDIDWYNENKNENGDVTLVDFTKSNYNFNKRMRGLCGKVVTISRANKYSYDMVEDNGVDFWTNEMIEGLVEEPVLSAPNITEDVFIHEKDMKCTTEEENTNESKKVAWFTFGDNDFADKVELDLSNRELIQEDGKWFVVKKKKEYPKSFGECCKVLGTYSHNQSIVGYKNELFSALQKLIICRDAYWKLAGEEMGLGKSWEPDFASCKIKYAITYYNNVVSRYSEVDYNSTILVFPTEEMRNAFYNNFKEEIEMCKTLL